MKSRSLVIQINWALELSSNRLSHPLSKGSLWEEKILPVLISQSASSTTATPSAGGTVRSTTWITSRWPDWSSLASCFTKQASFPHSLATALANSVLPVPGSPWSWMWQGRSEFRSARTTVLASAETWKESTGYVPPAARLQNRSRKLSSDRPFR